MASSELDFEELLKKYDYNFQKGDLVKGIVCGYDSQGVMVDIGAKTIAVVPTREAVDKDENVETKLEKGKEYDKYKCYYCNPGKYANHGGDGLFPFFLFEGGMVDFLFLIFSQNTFQLVRNFRTLFDEGIFPAADLATDVFLLLLDIFPSCAENIDNSIRIAQCGIG